MPSFRLLPHGFYSMLPTLFTTTAWLASLFQDGCNFGRLKGDLVRQMASSEDVPYLEVGFSAFREPTLNFQTDEWQVEYTGRCLAYQDEYVQQDTYWTVSKGFAFFSLVLGGGSTFFLWFSSCCVFSRGTWRWAGYQVTSAAMLQSLTFLWFRTSMCYDDIPNTTCELGWGSRADLVATILWTLAACLIMIHYPKPKTLVTPAGDGLYVPQPQKQKRRRSGGRSSSKSSSPRRIPMHPGDASVASSSSPTSDCSLPSKTYTIDDYDDDDNDFESGENSGGRLEQHHDLGERVHRRVHVHDHDDDYDDDNAGPVDEEQPRMASGQDSQQDGDEGRSLDASKEDKRTTDAELL